MSLPALTARQVQSHFSRHPLHQSAWDGVRDDVEPWIRWPKGGQRPPADTLRPNSALIDAIKGLHMRRGRVWDPVGDGDLVTELDSRAFGWGEVLRQKTWSLPSWITAELVPPRRMGGYSRFLAVLIRAFRQGAVGVLLSYEECQALCDVGSRATWRRWCVDMEERRLVRIVQIWDEGGRAGRRRRHARLLYRIGPAIEEAAGYGIVEGAAPTAARGRWAERAACGARHRARTVRKARRAELRDLARPAGVAPTEPNDQPTPPSPPAAAPEPHSHERRPEPPKVEALSDGQPTGEANPTPEGHRQHGTATPKNSGPTPSPSRRTADVSSDVRAEHASLGPKTRPSRPPTETAPQGGQRALTTVHFKELPPPCDQERSGRPGPARGSMLSPEGGPALRAAPPAAVSTEDNEPPTRGGPTAVADRAMTGGAPEGAGPPPRRGELDGLWARLLESPHTDPRLRSAVLRFRQRRT